MTFTNALASHGPAWGVLVYFLVLFLGVWLLKEGRHRFNERRFLYWWIGLGILLLIAFLINCLLGAALNDSSWMFWKDLDGQPSRIAVFAAACIVILAGATLALLVTRQQLENRVVARTTVLLVLFVLGVVFFVLLDIPLPF
jgi:cytochrome bd-type quinol oxidase subunit 2